MTNPLDNLTLNSIVDQLDVGGGIFTQKIVAQLKKLADSHASISTRELITSVTPDLARLSKGGQSPKLVTLTGPIVARRPVALEP